MIILLFVNGEQLLFECFFDALRIFGSVDHQSESTFLLSRFHTLLYFKDGNLSWPLVSLWGGGAEIDMCPRGLFSKKFDGEQLLFECFFDATRIFGSVELQTESAFPFL